MAYDCCSFERGEALFVFDLSRLGDQEATHVGTVAFALHRLSGRSRCGVCNFFELQPPVFYSQPQPRAGLDKISH